MVRAQAYYEAREEAIALVREQGWWDPPLEHAEIHFAFHIKSKRRRDPENLSASMKPYTDGIVAAGVVKDDDIAHVKVSYTFVHGAAENGVTITIKESPGGIDAPPPPR